jgi:MFS transporter, ACDE family, multidrug resistance protein
MGATTETGRTAVAVATTPRPRVLAVLLLASTLGVMAGAIVMPVLELVRRDMDLSGTSAGLIITTHGLVIAATGTVVGKVFDRRGLRVPMAVGLALYGFGGGAGVVTSGYPALLASRVVLGLGAALVFSGTTVALLALYQGPDRDRVMGWRGTAMSLGGLVWPLLAGVLGGFGWQAAFTIYLVALPLGVMTLLWLPDDRPRPGAAVVHDGAIGLVRHHPALGGWYALMLLAGLLLYSLAVFLPQRLGELGVLDPLRVSLFMVAMATASSLVGLLYARLRTRASERDLLLVTASCWVAAFLVLGVVSQPQVLLVAAALFGIGQGLMLPAITVLIGDAAGAAHRGQATALSATALFVGQFLSPLLFGPLMAATSIAAGYLVAAVVSTGIALALTAASRARSRSEVVAGVGVADR